MITSSFPAMRHRRLRQADWIRRLVRETETRPSDLIWSMVVHDGKDARIPVASMPGMERLNVTECAKAAKEAKALGIPCIAIFPHIDGAKKDPRGSEADNPNGLVADAIKAMKDAAPEVGIMCDVALDPFTINGHDGIVERGTILNDATVERLVSQGLMQAEAGADIIAPSDMMDGRIAALRNAFEGAGHQNLMIMSYAAKYASAFYGPYRDAIGSGKLGTGPEENPADKKTYQMDPANTDAALREVALDIAEGADMVMVKPGMPYLDIIRRVSETFDMPTFAFQVSGEYAMIMAASNNGWLDGDRAVMESLGAFKRAGADGVITYFAARAARLMGA